MSGFMVPKKKVETAPAHPPRLEQEKEILSGAYARVQIRNRALERLLHTFTDLSDPNKVLQEIMDTAMEAIPSEAGSLLLTQPGGDLRFVAARGPVAHKLIGICLRRGVGIAGACALDKQIITVSDVGQDPRHAAEISRQFGFTTTSLLAAPIIHKGDVLGVLELVNKKDENIFPRHEIELMERVTRAAGSLLYLMDALT